MMGALAVSMFGRHHRARHRTCTRDALAERQSRRCISQVRDERRLGGSSLLFYLFQAATAGILVLAANTAFNGFPGACLDPGPRPLPAAAAAQPRRPAGVQQRHPAAGGVRGVLIVGFDANIDRLIQLYIIGVFTCFTLSQAGMVGTGGASSATETDAGQAPRGSAARRRSTRWAPWSRRSCWSSCSRRSSCTARGSPCSAMLVLFVLMRAISRYYRRRSSRRSARSSRRPRCRAECTRVVLVSTSAPADATGPGLRHGDPPATGSRRSRSRSPTTRTPVGCNRNGSVGASRCRWSSLDLAVPRRDPSRSWTTSAVACAADQRDVVSVFIPEYVVGTGGSTCCTTRARYASRPGCCSQPGVMVTSVPYHIGLVDQGWMTQPVLPEVAAK